MYIKDWFTPIFYCDHFGFGPPPPSVISQVTPLLQWLNCVMVGRTVFLPPWMHFSFSTTARDLSVIRNRQWQRHSASCRCKWVLALWERTFEVHLRTYFQPPHFMEMSKYVWIRPLLPFWIGNASIANRSFCSQPLTGWKKGKVTQRPRGFWEVKAPRFLNNSMVVGCQPYAPVAFTPVIVLVLIFTKGCGGCGLWFCRMEICHWKIQWHHRESIPGPSD